MKLKYVLKPEEMEESLLCLSWHKEGVQKYINVGILAVIAAACLYWYAANPEQFLFMFLAALSIGLMFLMLYLPAVRRRWKVRRMMRSGETYQIEVPGKDIKKGFESEQVFTIRTQEQVFCIPKRILSDSQMEEIRVTLENHAKQMYVVTT